MWVCCLCIQRSKNRTLRSIQPFVPLVCGEPLGFFVVVVAVVTTDRMNVLKRKDAFKILPIGHYCLQIAMRKKFGVSIARLKAKTQKICLSKKTWELEAASVNFLLVRHCVRLLLTLLLPWIVLSLRL